MFMKNDRDPVFHHIHEVCQPWTAVNSIKYKKTITWTAIKIRYAMKYLNQCSLPYSSVYLKIFFNLY